MERLTGHERKSSDLITLIAGVVAVSVVLINSGATCLINSGATCNMVGQQTWEMKEVVPKSDEDIRVCMDMRPANDLADVKTERDNL